MAIRAIIGSLPVNLLAAAAGLAGTLVIAWFFGPAVFAVYTINISKLAIVLLGLELLPSSFSIYHMQHDPRFAAAMPLFFLLFAGLAAAICALLIAIGYIDEASWAMLLYVVLAVSQRYFDNYLQAEGKVPAFLWIPAIGNSVRLLVLVALVELSPGLAAPDVLWISLAAGMVVGQLYAALRFPAAPRALASSLHRSSAAILWAQRRNYYPHYLNSILRRLRDVALPLFVDTFMADKAAAGRFFLYFRAVEFACAQVRMIEAFMVNLELRSALQPHRMKLLASAVILGQLATVTIALGLLYRDGVTWQTAALAAAISLFLIPYVIELYMRSLALAAFEPTKVTASMVVNLVSVLVLLGIFHAIGRLEVGTLIAAVVISQALSAATYFLPGIGKRALAPRRRA